MTILTTRISVLIMREKDAEIGDKVLPLCRYKKGFTKTRKGIPRRLDRSCFDVAVGTDPRNRPLAREELLAVTTQTGLMLRILSHIRKGLVTFAYLFPIL